MVEGGEGGSVRGGRQCGHGGWRGVVLCGRRTYTVREMGEACGGQRSCVCVWWVGVGSVCVAGRSRGLVGHGAATDSVVRGCWSRRALGDDAFAAASVQWGMGRGSASVVARRRAPAGHTCARRGQRPRAAAWRCVGRCAGTATVCQCPCQCQCESRRMRAMRAAETRTAVRASVVAAAARCARVHSRVWRADERRRLLRIASHAASRERS